MAILKDLKAAIETYEAAVRDLDRFQNEKTDLQSQLQHINAALPQARSAVNDARAALIAIVGDLAD